jgi:hypothetical protein
VVPIKVLPLVCSSTCDFSNLVPLKHVVRRVQVILQYVDCLVVKRLPDFPVSRGIPQGYKYPTLYFSTPKVHTGSLAKLYLRGLIPWRLSARTLLFTNHPRADVTSV